MSNAKPPRPLATREEVAGYLGITTKALDQWRRQGKGPKAYSIGRAVRYRWHEVEEWVDERYEAMADEPDETQWPNNPPERGGETDCLGAAGGCVKGYCDHVWCWTCREWQKDTGDPDRLGCTHERSITLPAA